MSEEELHELNDELIALLLQIRETTHSYQQHLKQIDERYRWGALNLLQYLVLRSSDLRQAQFVLEKIGLSSLARSEHHITEGLLNVQRRLSEMMGQAKYSPDFSFLTSSQSATSAKYNEKAVFGEVNNSKSHIMLSLSESESLGVCGIENLIKEGVDSFRLNLSQGETKFWLEQIALIREAENNLNQPVRIVGDLGGNKLRLLVNERKIGVKSFSLPKDGWGRACKYRDLILRPESSHGADVDLYVEDRFIEVLRAGETLLFHDFRNKKPRKGIVLERNEDGACKVRIQRKLVVSHNTLIEYLEKDKVVAHTTARKLDNVGNGVRVRCGDEIYIAQTTKTELEQLGVKQFVNHKEALYQSVKEGEKVFLDDGKVEGVITEVHQDYFKLIVKKTKPNGTLIHNNKGLNLPETCFDAKPYSIVKDDKARSVLPYLDAICLSYVNSVNDVKVLFRDLKQLKVPESLAVILKLETRKAYEKLPDILMEGMRRFPLAVMIARGDLAVECGWENLAKIQEDIRSICDAALIPDVWATQVLDNLAKTGIPTRAEISDVSLGHRSSCIMLNKGLFVEEAVKMINRIKKRSSLYLHKRTFILDKNIERGQLSHSGLY